MGQYFYSVFVNFLFKNIIGSTLKALNLKYSFIVLVIYFRKAVNRRYFK